MAAVVLFLNLHDVKAKDFLETVILALSKTKISHEKKKADKTKTSRQLEFFAQSALDIYIYF